MANGGGRGTWTIRGVSGRGSGTMTVDVAIGVRGVIVLELLKFAGDKVFDEAVFTILHDVVATTGDKLKDIDFAVKKSEPIFARQEDFSFC